jgi:hypothetical protein
VCKWRQHGDARVVLSCAQGTALRGLRLRTKVFCDPSAYYGGRPCVAVVVLSPSSHNLLHYPLYYLTNILTCVLCAAAVANSVVSTLRKTQVTEVNVTEVGKVPVRHSVLGRDGRFFFTTELQHLRCVRLYSHCRSCAVLQAMKSIDR